MKKQQELLILIDIVFDQSILPCINEIYENECCKIECIESLGINEWKETILDNLICSSVDILEVITCLSHKGFLYYLPIFLQFILINYDDMDVLGDLVIDRLTPKLNNMNVPRASWIRNIYDCLTDQQRKCTQEVLLYLWEKYDDGLAEDALNNYWFDNP